MKVVHLNTHPYGGAAVVARRLHKTGLARGLNSRLITKYGRRSAENVGYTPLRSDRVLSFLRRQSARPTLYKVGKAMQGLQQHRNLTGRPQGLEIFSPPNDAVQFADCADDFDPEIMHLHWINGFLDHQQFFSHNRHRKFVWTLHDMNPFTGGCHHADGCSKFELNCSSCPQLAGTIDAEYAAHGLVAKTDILAPLNDDQLIVVAPSRWLLELSARSRVLARFRHVQIDNPSLVPPQLPQRSECRDALGLPPDGKLVLFVSGNLRNPRKGFDLLFAAVRQLAAGAEINLVGLGQRGDVPDGVRVSYPGTISDEGMLARYLSCADALVLPSVAENSPLVIIEALTCGTPVVAFDVGGISELVTEESGVLVHERTADALAMALREVLFFRKYDRENLRAGSRRFGPQVVLDRYHTLYAEVLAS